VDKNTNIVFILSDDQGSWAMGCAGNGELETPNIDSLAQTGIRFENFFCTCPVCSPARASILTGTMPSSHGIHDYLSGGDSVSVYGKKHELVEYLEKKEGYTDFLAREGYLCGMVGKWHIGNCYRPQKGFSFWHPFLGRYYNHRQVEAGKEIPHPEYSTDAITGKALNFLETAKKSGKPFYLGINYISPHSPWEREDHPAATFDRYYRDCPFDSVPSGKKPPEWARRLNIPVKDEETRRVFLSGYFAAISEMDRNIGQIMRWLEHNDLRKNTLVVFMSDNGMNMGHHGIFGKGNATFPLNMFEESVKVPCIFSHPGFIPSGRVDSSLLNQYDFMPTILEYAGIKGHDSKDLPGKSFLPVILGKSLDEKEFVVVFDEYGPVRMARTRDWKYIHRYPYGHHELYNLSNDPGETENIAGLPEYEARENEMRGMLREWFLKYGDPSTDGAYEAVTGFGQVGPCGKRAKGRNNFNPVKK